MTAIIKKLFDKIDNWSRLKIIYVCLILCIVAFIFSIYQNKPWWVTILCFILIIILIIFIIYIQNLSEKIILTSNEWFERIISNLENTTRAHIYIRNFVHPEDFKGKHKDALIQIMKLFAKLIDKYPETFRIIAHKDKSQRKCPINWLIEEMRSNDAEEIGKKIKQTITILNKEPVSNSSTIYLINHVLLYNHIDENGKNRYFYIKLYGNIIGYLIAQGFYKVFKGN